MFVLIQAADMPWHVVLVLSQIHMHCVPKKKNFIKFVH